jgi:hypothetical protein
MAPTPRPSGGSLPATDGPFAVNVATTDAAGNTATATQTLTLDRGTQVAITGRGRRRQHDQRG